MSTQIGVTPSDPYITPDIVPTPGPAVAGVIQTTITAKLLPIVSGTTTINAETFNGTIPGPTLRLNVGDTAIVRLINDLPYPTRHSLARHRAGELRRRNRGDAA